MGQFDGPHATGGQIEPSEEEAMELEELSKALPWRLAEFLAGLAYLTPTGRQLALETMGPGSRLVLEALRLVDQGSPAGLTDLGLRLSEHLAEDRPLDTSVVVGIGGRMGKIARIVPVQERGLAAASTSAEDQEQEAASHVIYELAPDPGDPGHTGASILVARDGTDLMLWQHGGRDAVVVLESMDRLPRGGAPVVVPNPENEPPSRLLRRRLVLSDENDD
jgi:hypothetical protein